MSDEETPPSGHPERPTPRVFMDGDSWCALSGENIQEGIAGFGSTEEEAVDAFKRALAATLCRAGSGCVTPSFICDRPAGHEGDHRSGEHVSWAQRTEP